MSKENSSKNLTPELPIADRQMYFCCIKITLNHFEQLFTLVALGITKTTIYRKPISPEQRLSLALSQLASREPHNSLSF